MKSSRLVACLFTLGIVCSSAWAGTDSTKAVVAPKELKAQTNCPVMGGKIDSAAYTDIQGQRVYHCCPACSKKLKGDPDTYFKKASEQGVVFQNIQTACPVSGKPIDKKFESYYEGRRVYFADAASKTKFDAAPKEYLAKMDAVKDSDAAKTK